MVPTFVIDSCFPILVPDPIAINICAGPASACPVHTLCKSILLAADICHGEVRHKKVPHCPPRRIFWFRLDANSKEGELITKPLRAAGEITCVVPPFNLIGRMACMIARKLQDIPAFGLPPGTICPEHSD